MVLEGVAAPCTEVRDSAFTPLPTLLPFPIFVVCCAVRTIREGRKGARRRQRRGDLFFATTPTATGAKRMSFSTRFCRMKGSFREDL